jgi:2,3-bisphosphoglycerate-dependent phosphoglycerate mutase
MVGVKVGHFWYEIGTGDFFNSWFSTINYHLEGRKWGAKFPVLMNNFHQGTVCFNSLSSFKKELIKVQKKLKKINPEKVIWDIRDLEKRPPWGDEISSDITSLSNYFVTCNGKDLFEVLFIAIGDAMEGKEDLKIDSI